MKTAAFAVTLAILSTGARASEAVLVYAAKSGAPEVIALVTVGKAVKSALRAAGREPVERSIESALEVLQQRSEAQLPPLAATANGAKRRLSVVTDPPGAAVIVDGQAIGKSPIALDVAEGDHAVEALLRSHLADGANVSVGTAGLAIELTLPVDANAEAIAALRNHPDKNGLRALGAALSLEGIFIVTAGSDAGDTVLVGQRFDVKAGAATPVASVRVKGSLDGGAAALVRQMATARASGDLVLFPFPLLDAPRPPSPKPPPPPTVKARSPFYLSVYFWGGLLVAGLGGVLLGTLLPTPPATGSVAVDGSAFTGR